MSGSFARGDSALQKANKNKFVFQNIGGNIVLNKIFKTIFGHTTYTYIFNYIMSFFPAPGRPRERKVGNCGTGRSREMPPMPMRHAWSSTRSSCAPVPGPRIPLGTSRPMTCAVCDIFTHLYIIIIAFDLFFVYLTSVIVTFHFSFSMHHRWSFHAYKIY